MERLKYYSERLYPYIVAMIIMIVAMINDINYYKSEDLPNVLNACTTIVALIIGFLGAILPVILGMKNESKIVKYVFEKDKNKLFLKYIKATIFWGLVTVAVAMSMYLINDYSNEKIAYYEFYLWVFLIILFLLLTYRSLKSMLDLVFLSDDNLNNQRNNTVEKSEEEKNIEMSFSEENMDI